MNSFFTDQRLEIAGYVLCALIVGTTLIVQPINGFSFYTIAGGKVPVSFVYMWINGLVALWAIARGRTRINVLLVLVLAFLAQALVYYLYPPHIWALLACVSTVIITLAWSEDRYFDALLSPLRASSLAEWFFENKALVIAYGLLCLAIYFSYGLALNLVSSEPGQPILIRAIYLKFFCLFGLIAIRRGSNHANVVYIVIAAILIELLIGLLDWNPAAYVMNAVMFLIVAFRFSEGFDAPALLARLIPSPSLSKRFSENTDQGFKQSKSNSSKSKGIFDDLMNFSRQQAGTQDASDSQKTEPKKKHKRPTSKGSRRSSSRSTQSRNPQRTSSTSSGGYKRAQEDLQKMQREKDELKEKADRAAKKQREAELKLKREKQRLEEELERLNTAKKNGTVDNRTPEEILGLPASGYDLAELKKKYREAAKSWSEGVWAQKSQYQKDLAAEELKKANIAFQTLEKKFP